MGLQLNIYRKLNLKDRATVRGFQAVAKTDSYTVTKNDSGKLLIANKATAVTFTLPAPAAAKGCFWFFADIGAGGMVIAGDNNIVAKNDAAASSVTYGTENEIIGAACMVICDGTRFYHYKLTNCTATIA